MHCARLTRCAHLTCCAEMKKTSNVRTSNVIAPIIYLANERGTLNDVGVKIADSLNKVCEPDLEVIMLKQGHDHARDHRPLVAKKNDTFTVFVRLMTACEKKIEKQSRSE